LAAAGVEKQESLLSGVERRHAILQPTRPADAKMAEETGIE
jgi:hypothetical protein